MIFLLQKSLLFELIEEAGKAIDQIDPFYLKRRIIF